MLQDFKKFIMRGNVVDLAVAVVIGVAFQAVVNAFVNYIINPIIAAIFGKPDITQVMNITLRESDEGDAVLSIGGFLQAVLDFLIIGAALFLVVKSFEKLQERRRRGDEPVEETPTPSDEAVLLTEIRDLLATQRG
ncbi:MAG TPA: large conductance mechanosensitive channel protein MscL [Acidimicrobiales bacterium]|nr:large conductance mechanosensitive channel protein MscL [Acidimicrobiales bacterium]